MSLQPGEKSLEVKETPHGLFHNHIHLCTAQNSFLLVKILIFTASTCILIWQVKECISRYQLHETTTILSVTPTGEATFIAFTVCPAVEAAYKEGVLETYGSNRTVYGSGNYWVNSLGVNKTPQAIHSEVTYNLSEILVNLTLIMASGPDVLITNNVSTLDPAVGVWKVKYDILYGMCYAINLSPQLTIQAIKQVNVYANINVYVYLHHPGQFFDYNSMTKLYGMTNQSVNIDVAYEIITLTLEDDVALPCSSDQDVNFDDCMLTKSPAAVMKQVGCTVPYIPDAFPKCDRNNASLVQQVLAAFVTVESNAQKNICPRPCSSIEVYPGLPYLGNSTGPAFVQIYLKSTTKINKVVLDYTFVTMMAEIGGYTGLLLGISLVHLTYIVEILFQKCRK